MRVKQEVLKLVKKHKTNDPFKIAKSKNIHIFYRQLGKILGFYTMSHRIQMIYINSNIEEHYLARFVCAHELGHSVLHPKVSTPFMRQNTLFSVDKIEKEANWFAVELLLSDKDLDEHHEPRMTLYEMAMMCGVPSEFAYMKNY